MTFLRLMMLTAILAGCAAQTRPVPQASAAGHSAAPPSTPQPSRPPATYRNQTTGPAPDRTRTGRYSYVANGADTAQIDPLLAIIDIRLPGSLGTVEEAADYLLRRSGYCLMEPEAGEVRHLLRLPLPDVHRHFGPMTLRQALMALGGQAFELVVDDVYREVGYRVIPGGPA